MSGVQIDVSNHVLRAAIDRPDAMNAIDESVIAGLDTARRTVVDDDSVRAMVITGRGSRAFCAGLDLDLLERAFDDLRYFRSVLERLQDVLLGLEDLPVPVVAAVNGLTRAGGFELLLACDLVVVAEEARIGDGHLEVSVIPGGGGSQRAPRKLGDQRARELILLGRWLNGTEAVDVGLALEAVPRARLMSAVDDLLDPLGDRSRDAVGVVKSLLRDGYHLPLREAVQLEIDRFIGYLATSDDPHDGFAASRASVRGK